MIIPLEDIAQ